MAKYDWIKLEKEYILSNYKSVSAFLKDKGITISGSTKSKTKGWKEKKALKEEKKSTKTIEKVIEKESEKEAQQIVDIKSIANDLALNIIQANKELNMHIAKSKKKAKVIEYNNVQKINKEIISEKEEITSYISIVDRKGLKQLTSALKDLNDIINNKQNETGNTDSLAEVIQKAYENKVGDK